MTDKKKETKKDEKLPEVIVQPERVPVVDTGEFSNWLDSARYDHFWRIANTFAGSGEMVPVQFQGNAAACMIAVQMAFRLEVDPMMFLQKSYIIKGRPGIEATLAISLANKKGPFAGRIQYRIEGDPGHPGSSCTAYAFLKDGGELCEMPLTWEDVISNGWSMKDTWKKMPRLMMMYRSAMWLIRTFCPEVILGMNSFDELREMSQEETTIQAENLEDAGPGPEEIAAKVSGEDTEGTESKEEANAPQDAPQKAEPAKKEKEAPKKSTKKNEPGETPYQPDESMVGFIESHKGLTLEKGVEKIRNYFGSKGITGQDGIQKALEEMGLYTDVNAQQQFSNDVLLK